MSDLVVIAFPTEAKAEEVRQKLLAMQKEYLIELGDAVIAVKDSKGQIKLNQLINTTAAGAVTVEFEPEYNGDQAIDNRLPPPAHGTAPLHPHPRPSLPEAGPGTPPARVLLQEVENLQPPKSRYN